MEILNNLARVLIIATLVYILWYFIISIAADVYYIRHDPYEECLMHLRTYFRLPTDISATVYQAYAEEIRSILNIRYPVRWYLIKGFNAFLTEDPKQGLNLPYRNKKNEILRHNIFILQDPGADSEIEKQNKIIWILAHELFHSYQWENGLMNQDRYAVEIQACAFAFSYLRYRKKSVRIAVPEIGAFYLDPEMDLWSPDYESDDAVELQKNDPESFKKSYYGCRKLNEFYSDYYNKFFNKQEVNDHE